MKKIPVIPIRIDSPNPFKVKDTITEKGDAPTCSREKVENFKKNWERILTPKVISSIKRHNDILHGARSVNMLVGPKYSRPTKDFDVYSDNPQRRAVEIENEIDRCCGCDMAQVRHRSIPKVLPGEDDPLMAKDLYIVETIPNNDGDVDYMKTPRGIPTTRKNGIRHETLKEAYRKAQRNKDQPMRMVKTRQDINRIEEYWKSTRRKKHAPKRK